MPTLWEVLTKKKPKDIVYENTIANPLNIRIGDSVKINTIDFEKENFTFKNIREIKRTINEQVFLSTDYEIESEKHRARLLLLPVANPDANLTHDAILLKQLGDAVYDQTFHKGLGEEFVEGKNLYWRVNDTKTSWMTEITVLEDEDHSGKVDKDEVKKSVMEYWDYWRETVDEADNKILEFYYVELEQGYFTFWCGPKIEPTRIVL